MNAAVPLCAEISRSRHEPLAGTAAHAEVVIAVEERGAWAPKAMLSCGLEPIRATLETWLTSLGARLQLIRQPNRCEGPRRVFVSRTGVEGTLHQWDLEDSEFATFDLEAALHPSKAAPLVGSVHLVCVHGKRDRCCALEGGAYFRARAPSERVWMTSHLGGHRFAATTLTLPSGLCHGHLNVEEAALPFEALPLSKLRGRVCYPGAVQAAEASLLLTHPEMSFAYEGTEEVSATQTRVRFRSADEGYEVALEKVTHAPQVLSCGDVAKPSASWRVEVSP